MSAGSSSAGGEPALAQPGASYARLAGRSRKRADAAIKARTRHDNARRHARYQNWAEARGMNPDEPETFVCYLHYFNLTKNWADTQMATVRSAVRRVRLEAALTDPSAVDPTDSPLVARYLNAAARSQRFRDPKVKDPLMEEHIIQMAAMGSVRQTGAGEIYQRRGEAALLVCAEFQVPTRQLIRLRRPDVTMNPESIVLDLPEVPPGGGPGLPPRTVVVSAEGHSVAYAALARFLDLLDEHRSLVGDGVFNLLDCRGDAPPRTSARPMMAANLRGQWGSALARSGLEIELSDPPVLHGVDPDEVSWLCHNMNPNLRHDIRNLAIAAIGVGDIRRHEETKRMTVADLEEHGWGYLWKIPEQKNRRDPIWVRIEHVDGHPPHCPACLLRAWMGMAGIESGLVFRSMRAGGRLMDGPVDAGAATLGTKDLTARAGIAGDYGSSSCRKGGATSRAYRGETPEEIIAVSGHKDEDIMFRHYVFLSRLLGAVATRRNALAVHQLGQPRPGPRRGRAAGGTGC